MHASGLVDFREAASAREEYLCRWDSKMDRPFTAMIT